MDHPTTSSSSSSSTSSSNMQPITTSRQPSGSFQSNTTSSSMQRDRLFSSSSSYSSSVASANQPNPKGMVVISQGLPRTRGVVDGHLMSNSGAPRLFIYQAGFQRAGTTTWTPMGLVNKLTNKLPQQETPATALFPDLEVVKQHLGPLLELDSEITGEHVVPLTNLFNASHQETSTLRLPRPSIISDEEYESFATPSTRGPSASSPIHVPFSSSSRRSTPAVDTTLPTESLTVSHSEIAQLTRQLAELSAQLGGRSNSTNILSNNAPSFRNGRPASIARSSRSPSHHNSRSRSRERSLVRLREYGELQVLSSYTDDRAPMNPLQQAKNSARQCRTNHRIITDLYIAYPSASHAAHHILTLSRSFNQQITWEKTSLTHWAKLRHVIARMH